jgi:hypothetical protein
MKSRNISPRSGFKGNVFGENKLHIRNQHDELPPSPSRSREGTSDHKQKKIQQLSMEKYIDRTKKKILVAQDSNPSRVIYAH